MKQQHTLQPKLRFPEFEGDWKSIKLDNIASKIGSGKTPLGGDKVYQTEGIPFIRSQNVNSDQLILDDTFIPLEVHKSMNSSKVIANDILLNITGASIGRSCVVPNDFIEGNVNQHVCIIRIKNEKPIFIQKIISSNIGQKLIYETQTGSGREGLNFESIKKFKINIPSLPEQQKIADYLSTIDTKINLLEEKKAQLALYKKAMMQKLFSQEIRFKDEKGNDFPEWESFQLKDILFEHKEKNKSNKYTEVVSVAKEKGVINQIEHLGRSYSAENIEHYKVVNPFDVVYTKSPTSGFPFGIIKQNKLNRSAVLSPLYAVFKPKTIYLGMLLHDLFLSEVETFNYLVPLVQKGAKNTMNINNEDFLNGKKYKLPTSEKEQQKIADFLSAIDESIEKVNEQITQTQSFKKAMLQQMFV